MPSSTVILISQDAGLIKDTKQWAQNQSIKIQVFSHNEWGNYVKRPIAITESFQTDELSSSQIKHTGEKIVENSASSDEMKNQLITVLPTSAIESNEENPYQGNEASHCSLNSPLAPKARRVQTMSELENHAIREAIFEFNGNLTEAAKALGIGRATLYRKVKQYDIDLVATRKKIAS